jgi:hypothetical protein
MGLPEYGALCDYIDHTFGKLTLHFASLISKITEAKIFKS